MWSRRGQPGPGIGLIKLMISTEISRLLFLHLRVLRMATELCILFLWNTPELRDTWDTQGSDALNAFLQRYAFELVGYTAGPLFLSSSDNAHWFFKTFQKSPSLKSEFLIATAANYLKQHKLVTAQFWECTPKGIRRLLGRICLLAFSSILTPSLFRVSWLPPLP